MKDLRNPDKEEIKGLFNEVHNVWLKKYWDAKTDEDFQRLVRDAQSIRERYPFQLTEVMTLEIAMIIEAHAKGDEDK